MNAKGTANYHESFNFYGSSSVVLLECEADLIFSALFFMVLSIST